MGQTNSIVTTSPENIIPETVSVIQDEVLRQARIITEIATLTYEDFQHCIKHLNDLSRKVTGGNGKMILFAVKKGTDSTVLWKGTVKISCVEVDQVTKAIKSHRLFNLNQFLKIFKTLECQLTAALQSSEKEMLKSSTFETSPKKLHSRDSSPKSSSDSESVSSNSSSYHESDSDCTNSTDSEKKNAFGSNENATSLKKINSDKKRANELRLKDLQMKKFTASMLLEEVDNLANGIAPSTDLLGECSICLERKPDVMLPCAHAYCMVCIEQWNTWNKTCPFCRETLQNPDDTWVISDIPGSQEISDEICSALLDTPD